MPSLGKARKADVFGPGMLVGSPSIRLSPALIVILKIKELAVYLPLIAPSSLRSHEDIHDQVGKLNLAKLATYSENRMLRSRRVPLVDAKAHHRYLLYLVRFCRHRDFFQLVVAPFGAATYACSLQLQRVIANTCPILPKFSRVGGVSQTVIGYRRNYNVLSLINLNHRTLPTYQALWR
jgi:hypothetical protein